LSEKIELNIYIEDLLLEIPKSASNDVPKDNPNREGILELIKELWTSSSTNKVLNELVTVS